MELPPWTGQNFVSTLHHKTPDSLRPDKHTLPTPFVVCVIGASRGIGAETAKAFAVAGATGIVLTARKEASLGPTKEACRAIAKSSALKISTLGADAGSAESAQQLADHIRREHGRLDVLVNNAGLMGTDETAFGTFEGVNDDQFQIPFQLNTLGRMFTTKYLLPIMLDSTAGGKTIINITSMAGHFTLGTPVAFNISALATNRLTEAVAEQYAERGLLVYAVHPGAVGATDLPPGFPEMFKAACIDEPDLCGAFCLWLVTSRPEWLSGRYLSANWDVGELEARREEIVSKDMLKMRMVV